MSAKIDCTCGKQYTWKPQLAGKRGKCQCGRIIDFPVEAPAVPAEIPIADSLDALAGLEATGQPISTDDAPPIPRHRVPEHRVSATAIKDSSTSSMPSLLVRLGIFVGGMAALGWFVLWPVVQVFQNEPRISVSFKGIVLAGMIAGMGISVLLLGEKGIPWKKTADQPLTSLQQVTIYAICGGALVLAGVMWLFFKSHGYTIVLARRASCGRSGGDALHDWIQGRRPLVPIIPYSAVTAEVMDGFTRSPLPLSQPLRPPLRGLSQPRAPSLRLPVLL